MSIWGNPIMMGGSGGGGGEGMTPLQYIASTGAGEYIDTGYAVNADTDLIIATVEIDSTNPNWASPYGVMEGGGVGECIFYAKNNGSNNCFFCWGGPSYTSDFSDYYGKTVTIRATRNIGQVYSGKSVINLSFNQSGSISTYPLYLFTTDNFGSAITDTHICKMKLYGFDIYEGAVQKRMFRPALDAAGTPGLYEFFTDTFFYNQGPGAFTYSPPGSGGEIPLCRYNLAVNWDFADPSNSRGNSSYTSSGSLVWALDGWQIMNGTMTVAQGGIKLSGSGFGYMTEWMTNDMSSRLVGQELTLTGWVDDTINSVTFTLDNTTGVQASVTVDGLDFYIYRNDGTTVTFNIGGNLSESSNKLIKAIKLEIGDTSTLRSQSGRLLATTTPLTELIRTRQTVRYN
ncbi:MAG: hypothetical protein J6Q14_08345 [Oscillospiraceae bacterium]|nr:hypothetical protein [Oscillospiraceae bacterium]